ncbi:hypothetical protein AK812_SmicGene27362 [Symbiodinium microadriaticum]|uniref:Uncharacterized protein n=1 Tax=Symbiodinium microadriaticum TaxID=2951 RepID=A0A1Q9D739_SYMMI|nr:hypothetical protein AK812_SmicGene27362 [Symbiodinium microadriaticum]
MSLVSARRKWLEDWTNENQEWYLKDAEGKSNSAAPCEAAVGKEIAVKPPWPILILWLPIVSIVVPFWGYPFRYAPGPGNLRLVFEERTSRDGTVNEVCI